MGFRAHARRQTHWCDQFGSPFTAALCRLLAERLDDTTELGRRVLNWPRDAEADALVLRICGGLHARVRLGCEPALAALYPPAPLPTDDALWTALQPALAAPELLPWLDSAPQTNEVARSGVLMPGLMLVAHETGLPIRLYELGPSAGLNLRLDAYAYRLGTLAITPRNAPITLSPTWEGPDPPNAPVRITARAGIDLNPLNVADRADAARLLGYIWPDQTERLARAEAAVAAAALDPPPIARGDAAAFVESHVAPREGVATVVMHSIAFQYFPEPVKARIQAHMAAQGARATSAAPLAWLRFEQDFPIEGPPTLQLQLWPGGGTRLLAHAHSHGAGLRWVA